MNPQKEALQARRTRRKPNIQQRAALADGSVAQVAPKAVPRPAPRTTQPDVLILDGPRSRKPTARLQAYKDEVEAAVRQVAAHKAAPAGEKQSARAPAPKQTSTKTAQTTTPSTKALAPRSRVHKKTTPQTGPCDMSGATQSSDWRSGPGGCTSCVACYAKRWRQGATGAIKRATTARRHKRAAAAAAAAPKVPQERQLAAPAPAAAAVEAAGAVAFAAVQASKKRKAPAGDKPTTTAPQSDQRRVRICKRQGSKVDHP